MAPGLIVRQVLLWARNAQAPSRAEAVAGLAAAYLSDRGLSPDERREVGLALTAMLDDPSPQVRRALAEALADAAEAPRPLVVALANDCSEVAGPVLARSPVLADADLVDCAAIGDAAAQAAIARRGRVSRAVSAALAEVAEVRALVVLAGNPGAEITDASLWRMVERHGRHPALGRALLGRPGLPLDIRHAVALAVSAEVSARLRHEGRLTAGRAERALADARDRATVAMSAAAPEAEVRRLAAYLRRTGQLTPALILRALLSRNLPLAEAALAELTGLPAARVASLLGDRRGAGFGAVLDRAGLPDRLRPAFAAAVLALREGGPARGAPGTQLIPGLVGRALKTAAGDEAEAKGALAALLRRFEAEAARTTAREAAGLVEAAGFAEAPALPAARAREPLALRESDRVSGRLLGRAA